MTMQDPKEELKKRLEKLPALVDATIKAIKDVPEHKDARFYVTAGPGDLRVDLPRTKSLMTEYLRLLTRQGSWVPEKAAWLWANELEDGDIYYHFKHKTLERVALTVCFDANHASATCRLEKTGVKEVPVYKVVCDDHEEPKDVSDNHLSLGLLRLP